MIILSFINGLINDLNENVPLIQTFIFHFSDWKFFQIFASFGFIEHGDKNILRNQLNDQLLAFAKKLPMVGIEEDDRVLATFIIWKEDTEFIYLADYVRELYASSAIAIASGNNQFKDYLVLVEHFDLYRSLYFFHSENSPCESDPNFVKELCEILRESYVANKSNGDLFSAFYSICYGAHRGLLNGIIDFSII
jgi:hypothetical protein